MNFEEFLERLKNGETVEHITEGKNVECVGNEVYEDDDLCAFLQSIGAEIETFGISYAVIKTNEGNYYEVPYECRVNRFGNDFPEETVLFFERIYDITEEIKILETEETDMNYIECSKDLIAEIAYGLYKQDWIDNNTTTEIRLETLREDLLYKKRNRGE